MYTEYNQFGKRPIDKNNALPRTHMMTRSVIEVCSDIPFASREFDISMAGGSLDCQTLELRQLEDS